MDVFDSDSVLGKRVRDDGLGSLVDDVLRKEQDRKARDKGRKSVTIDESRNVQHIIEPDPAPSDTVRCTFELSSNEILR